MFVKTKIGNLIPLQNIKAIKGSDGTSTIILKTGERIKDERAPDAIFKEAYSHDTDVTPILEALAEVTKEAREFQAICTVQSAAFQDALNAQTKKFEALIKQSMDEANNTILVAVDQVSEVTKSLKRRASKLTTATLDNETAAAQVRGMQDSVAKLLEQLNAAIQEA